MPKSKSFLVFTEEPFRETRKTKRFNVHNTSGSPLGRILYHTAWRRYVFDAWPAIFDVDCLKEVMAKIEGLMDERQRDLAKRKSPTESKARNVAEILARKFYENGQYTAGQRHNLK